VPVTANLPLAPLRPFVSLAHTLRKHRDGILAAIELGALQRPP
jgi:transposase